MSWVNKDSLEAVTLKRIEDGGYKCGCWLDTIYPGRIYLCEFHAGMELGLEINR